MMDGMTYEERAQIAENRLQKLEGQIEQLISVGYDLALAVGPIPTMSSKEKICKWVYEVNRTRELIK